MLDDYSRAGSDAGGYLVPGMMIRGHRSIPQYLSFFQVVGQGKNVVCPLLELELMGPRVPEDLVRLRACWAIFRRIIAKKLIPLEVAAIHRSPGRSFFPAEPPYSFFFISEKRWEKSTGSSTSSLSGTHTSLFFRSISSRASLKQRLK